MCVSRCCTKSCDATDSVMSQIWLFVDVCLSTVSRSYKELFCVSCTSCFFSPNRAMFGNSHSWQVHVTIILPFPLWAMRRHFDTQIKCVHECDMLYVFVQAVRSVMMMKKTTGLEFPPPSHTSSYCLILEIFWYLWRVSTPRVATRSVEAAPF